MLYRGTSIGFHPCHTIPDTNKILQRSEHEICYSKVDSKCPFTPSPVPSVSGTSCLPHQSQYRVWRPSGISFYPAPCTCRSTSKFKSVFKLHCQSISDGTCTFSNSTIIPGKPREELNREKKTSTRGYAARGSKGLVIDL